MLPVITFAAQTTSGAGLVPCGVGSDLTTATQCEACNLVQLVQNVISFAIGISIPIAVALFAYAGFLYFTSGASPENQSKAKKIFKPLFLGFLLILGAWLIINTILFTILDRNQYPNSSWFKVDCTTLERPRTVPISEVIGNTLGNIPLIGSLLQGGATPSVTRLTLKCPAGFTLKEVGRDVTNSPIQKCVSADGKTQKDPIIEQDNPGLSLNGGNCNTFTSNRLLSCISAYESSCDPRAPSGVDLMRDGRAVSFGLTQWNLSANPINCTSSGGTKIQLDCPSAFGGGAYTRTNHDTFVKPDQEELFKKCVAWATDPKCNLEMAQNLLDNGNGSLKPWGNAVRNNCSSGN
jgi:hypothetical protein